MAEEDSRPLFLFDFGARETKETLRTRLLLEAETCLAIAGKPQRKMLEELRGYIVKNKSSDARIYPILRILHRYVNVTPTDFRDLTDLLGWDKALEFIDGVRPPNQVWTALKYLQNQGAPPEYIQEYWNKVLDFIERGEENVFNYVVLANRYTSTFRQRGAPTSAMKS